MDSKKLIHLILKKIKHPFVNVGYGDQSTRRKGSGIEKVDVRPYTPNDHAKYINRKLSAKHAVLLVNEYKKETNLTIDIYLDYNQNRETGIKVPTKTLIFDILEEINKICVKQKAKITYYDKECLQKNTPKTRENIKKIKEQTKNRYEVFWVRFSRKKQEFFSFINKMIHHAAKNHNQRIVCFFSDFLNLSEEGIQKLLSLQSYATILCFQVPVMTEGKNYNVYTITRVPKNIKNIYLIPLYETHKKNTNKNS